MSWVAHADRELLSPAAGGGGLDLNLERMATAGWWRCWSCRGPHMERPVVCWRHGCLGRRFDFVEPSLRVEVG